MVTFQDLVDRVESVDKWIRFEEEYNMPPRYEYRADDVSVYVNTAHTKLGIGYEITDITIIATYYEGQDSIRVMAYNGTTPSITFRDRGSAYSLITSASEEQKLLELGKKIHDEYERGEL